MEFTSFSYVVFLIPAVVLLRQLRGVAREWGMLLLSLIFYGTWDYRYVPLLIGIAAFTWYAGRSIAQQRGQVRRLWGPIVVILAILAVFKYSPMIVDVVNRLARSRVEPLDIILPLGISFFTFECISYLLDVYKGEKQLVPFRRFLLFPSFWPHMIAGPILRIKEFGPQLEATTNPTAGETLLAIDRILVGWIKKSVLANALAGVVDAGFKGAAQNTAIDNWMLAVAFGLQIYFDFSAYSDIAIGSARLVGITFPENFNLPYHSKSPSEFWTRWHMTLSRWIRDYLFFPLNLRAERRLWLRYAFLVLVMSAVGLWHGAGFSFILWGTWHGALMVFHRLVEKRAVFLPAKLRGSLGFVITFALVQAGWIFFRAPAFEQAVAMLGTMFTMRGLRPSYPVNDYLLVALAGALYFLVEPVARRVITRDAASVDFSRPTFWLRAPVYALSLQLIFMFDTSNVAFIYFQF
jgi:D-alanyl-lipoteichoic acid acyltransferase DltB (MBOAT superfamily)